MTWKSILCAYSGDATRGSGLRHAVKLARHCDAYLTGVLRHGPFQRAQNFAQRIPDHLLAPLKEADDKLVEEIIERFRTTVASGGLTERSEFVELDPAADGLLSEFAHGFDLIVTGAHGEIASEAHLSANPDMIALRSGRPVLVVPNGFEGDGLAERALVAWDGKRAATRALSDAMTILAEKSAVTLLSVGETPKGTERVMTNMRRHGVEVTAKTVNRRGSIAETILDEANHAGAKLIVMGAFEHSKFSHDLFGGVTTDVIDKTEVPVLMAH